MKRTLFVAVVIVLLGVRDPLTPIHQYCVGALHAQAVAAQQIGPLPEEPPHFPPGEYCERPRANAKHPCTCHRHCAQPDDPNTIVEDTHCLQFCSHDSCTCPIEGCP